MPARGPSTAPTLALLRLGAEMIPTARNEAEIKSSADLHFEDLLKLRPFEVYIDATGNHLVTSMAERRNIANCRDGRREAYLICAILNMAVHPDAISVLQGIIDDDGPGVTLKEQGDRWNQRLDDAETVIAKSRNPGEPQ